MVRALVGALWGALLGGLVGCLPCILILCDFAFFKLNEYDEMMGVLLYASLVTCVPSAALIGALIGALVALSRRAATGNTEHKPDAKPG